MQLLQLVALPLHVAQGLVQLAQLLPVQYLPAPQLPAPQVHPLTAQSPEHALQQPVEALHDVQLEWMLEQDVQVVPE